MADDEATDRLPDAPPDRGHVITAAVLFEAGLAPLALIVGWFLGRDPLDGFAWVARDAAWGALAALPMYGAFLAGLRRPVGALARVKRFLDGEMVPLLKGRPVSDLALIAVAAGVGEELLFRGALQGALADWLGVWGGLAAASVLFGLLHPITPAYIVIAGLLGAFLGGLWIVSGNLLTAVVAHALYDFLALRALLRDHDAGSRDADRESHE